MSDPERAVTQAQRVVGKFGDPIRASETTGLAVHLFYQWLKAGTVPQKHWATLLERAAAAGVDHTPWDYIAHLVAVAPTRELQNAG